MNRDAAHFRIGDTGMGIFLMLPQDGASPFWTETWVPSGKGSWMRLVLSLSRLQVRPPSSGRNLGNRWWKVLIHRVGKLEIGSNWKLLDCRRWWSWTYHPYLLWCHLVYVLLIWSNSWRCLCHGWSILYRIIQTMSWSQVWSCGRVKMAWRVSGLIGQGLSLASLLHVVPQSTKILVLLASL